MIRSLFFSWILLGMTSSLLLYGMATRSLEHSYQTTAPEREKRD